MRDVSFWGLRKIVACSHSSQCLLVSTVFGMVSSLHPTSLFLYVLVYIWLLIVSQAVNSLIGEVFDDISFDEFEKENTVSSTSFSSTFYSIDLNNSHQEDHLVE